MSTLNLITTLAVWYVPGFVAAAVMAHRGHDAAGWAFAAWIGGLLTAIAAVVWTARSSRALDDH